MRLTALFCTAALGAAVLAGATDARADAPRGSYTNSCRYADERGGVLYAECRDRNGNYRRTSLSLRECSGDIANDDGNLYCRGGGGGYSDDRDYRDDRDYDHEARYRHDRNDNCNTALGTGLGALAGAGAGAAINRGNDTGAAIAGGIIGAIIGNQVAKSNCNDDDYDAYYYQRGRYDAVYNGRAARWRNPNTGSYGEFRVIRSYNDYGYWNDNRWSRVSEREWRRNHRRYAQVQCRTYVETFYTRGGRRVEETHTVCRDHNNWRYIG